MTDCFQYVLKKLETVVSGSEHISSEKDSAIHNSAKDLSASHLRCEDKDIESIALYLMMENCIKEQDFSKAFQLQCDLSYKCAVLGCFEEFKSSILAEVRLLLKLERVEDAYKKLMH